MHLFSAPYHEADSILIGVAINAFYGSQYDAVVTLELCTEAQAIIPAANESRLVGDAENTGN